MTPIIITYMSKHFNVTTSFTYFEEKADHYFEVQHVPLTFYKVFTAKMCHTF